MPKTQEMLILGEDATPEQIRRLLNKIDLRQCVKPNGKFYSPITGEEFDSFYKLAGHIGARLRKIKQTPITNDRKGYVKALRRGVEPTDEQRKAHREYMRKYRNR